MEKIIVLSSKKYPDAKNKNYGDCFIIDFGKRLYLYDCGSKEHAERVLDYMKKEGHNKVTIILSHNDSDHFDGIPYLCEQGVVDKIFTVLLLKYIEEILNRIDDGRRNREGIKDAIKRKYDNINKLSGYPIYDIYLEGYKLKNEIQIIGPDIEYMLNTVAHDLDTREGNTTNGETNVNATSIQLQVNMFGKKMILCGDSPFESIEDKVRDFDVIQLPHHGKASTADEIFEKMAYKVFTIYVVSDNTGNSNGGSDNLKNEGHIVMNTKDNGDIELDSLSLVPSSYKTGGALGI